LSYIRTIRETFLGVRCSSSAGDQDLHTEYHYHYNDFDNYEDSLGAYLVRDEEDIMSNVIGYSTEAGADEVKYPAEDAYAAESRHVQRLEFPSAHAAGSRAKKILASPKFTRAMRRLKKNKNKHRYEILIKPEVGVNKSKGGRKFGMVGNDDYV
jgi:hypothetical protein